MEIKIFFFFFLTEDFKICGNMSGSWITYLFLLKTLIKTLSLEKYDGHFH